MDTKQKNDLINEWSETVKQMFSSLDAAIAQEVITTEQAVDILGRIVGNALERQQFFLTHGFVGENLMRLEAECWEDLPKHTFFILTLRRAIADRVQEFLAVNAEAMGIGPANTVRQDNPTLAEMLEPPPPAGVTRH